MVKNKGSEKENKSGTTAFGNSIRGIVILGSIAASIVTLNPVPAIAATALVYGNYDYNKRLGQKSEENVKDRGPHPLSKGLWRVAAVAIGTLLGGPVGFGIAAALVATDFLSNGKLTEATSKISSGNILGGIKDVVKAAVWDAPKSLLKVAWGLTKVAWSKITEAQDLSRKGTKVPEGVKGNKKEGIGENKGGPGSPGGTVDEVDPDLLKRSDIGQQITPEVRKQAVAAAKNLKGNLSPNEEVTSKKVVGPATEKLAQGEGNSANQKQGARIGGK